MEINKRKIYEFFQIEKRYVVPLFQRSYRWNEVDQWKPLWLDISNVALRKVDERRGVEPTSKLAPHFLGAIILKYSPAGQVASYEIVDGQQRLITLQIFLAALRDCSKERNANKEILGVLDDLTGNRNLSKDSDQVFKVWPTNQDRSSFASILRPGRHPTRHDVTETVVTKNVTQITKAYKYFRNCIEGCLIENTGDLNEVINGFLEAFRNSLQLVEIELDENDDPQLIFETMNARGQPLLTSDLIKNHVFQKIDGDVMEAYYEKYWSHFDTDMTETKKSDDPNRFWYKELTQSQRRRLRIDVFVFHYLTMQTGDDITFGDIYHKFKDWFKKENESPVRFLESFSKYSKLYKKIIEPSLDNKLGEFCDRVQHLGGATIYPLLLFLSDIEKRHDTDRFEFNKCIKNLESYMMRRFVCGYSAKQYNHFFREVLVGAKNAFKKEGQQRMFESICKDLSKSTAPTSCWPTDKEFQESWLNNKIYYPSKASRSVMILNALNDQMITKKNEKFKLLSKLTVEHLLPQKASIGNYPYATNLDEDDRFVGRKGEETDEDIRARLIHTIGNLTLVTQSLNGELSNGPFSSKAKAITQQSDLRINSWLRHETPSIWDEASILQNGSRLFKVAIEVWPRPPVD